MGFVKGTPVCSLNQQCLQWARIYLKYCLCSAKDGVSLTIGMISVISWGVAEVPQIITNYREKSTEGLSIAFLVTWIIGDLFNLMGCLLEPATLPTQLYMALLYTATTVILTVQTIYYRHIYRHMKANRLSVLHKSDKLHHEDKLTNKKLIGYRANETESKTSVYQADGSSPINASSPIPVAAPFNRRYSSSGRDLYYMSARSLSKSPIPTSGSWLAHSRDSGRAPPLIVPHNRHSSIEPLLSGLVPGQSAPPLNTKNTLCVVFSAAFFIGVYGFHLSMANTFHPSPPGMVMLVGRQLLQEKPTDSLVQEGTTNSGIGSFLGWAMAAIYMAGRLPQICLNIRRGNVEGINPLMFIFAVIGNSTYVGSILVKSLEWSMIRPNLPWLVDAGGCVLLDAFILIQFVYFRYRKQKNSESTDYLYLPA